jgi:hypothetical protein
MPPAEQNSPQSTKKELNQIGVGGIKSLRTFQGDVAEALGKNNTTVTKMVIAENVRKANNEAPITPDTPALKVPEVVSNGPEPVYHSGTKNVVLTFASLLLVAGGIYGGIYFYSQSPLAGINTPQALQKGGYTGLLSSNIQKKIVLGTLIDKRLEDVLAYEKTQAKLDDGQISELYFIKGTESEPFLITSEEFLNLSTNKSPEAVRRSLLPRFMYGFHKNSTSIEPYLVLKTEFFQNTFTGMLKWEPEILDDTKAWLSDKPLSAQNFTDRIFKNKDIRELKDNAGNILLMYGFFDKETLVITTNEETFLEILDRFEKQTYVR